jgi:hypothetical protein
MSSVTQSFDPGVHSAQASGRAMTVGAYAEGADGIDQSIAAMLKKIREGRNDPRVRKWAIEQLSAAGIDGRGNDSVKSKTQVLLDSFRASTSYSPDPVGTEFIPSAAATLCLDPNLCVRGDDCDGLTTAFCAVMLSIGIPARVVKQEFGYGQQQHVLAQVEDENGEWLYADPSTRLPVGSAAHATHEEFFDPMDELSRTTGTAGNEIVTLGRAPIIEAEYETIVATLAAPPATPFDQAQVDLTNQVELPIQAGDEYLTEATPDYAYAVSAYQAAGNAGATSVGPEIDLAGVWWVTQPLTHPAWETNAELQAIPSANATIEQAQLAQMYAKGMAAQYQQAINAGSAALLRGARPPVAGTPMTKALLYAGGVGVLAGIGYALLKPRKAKRR